MGGHGALLSNSNLVRVKDKVALELKTSNLCQMHCSLDHQFIPKHDLSSHFSHSSILKICYAPNTYTCV